MGAGNRLKETPPDAFVSPLKPILDYITEQRGVDFSGYRASMLRRRIDRRMAVTGSPTTEAYLAHLRDHAPEMDDLLDALTINVSRFFRNTLTFEYLADLLLPVIVLGKTRSGNGSLRVWSAGCAQGEEPYSLAILLKELLSKEGIALDLHLFSTDISLTALKRAREAVYTAESVAGVKYRLLRKYFAPEGSAFKLASEIREMVTFCRHNLLDKRHSVPQESIYGDFDIVLCRNVLIYVDARHQETIFARLHHALAAGGYLVLGEAESPTGAYERHFARVTDCGRIYQKR